MKTYRHVKRKTVYHIVGRAKMQIDQFTLASSQRHQLSTHDSVVAAQVMESMTLVVYRSVTDDTLWVRPESEFFDGRFEEVSS